MKRTYNYFRLASPFLFSGLAWIIAANFGHYFERTMVIPFVTSVFLSSWTAGLGGGVIAILLSIVTIESVYFGPS